MMISPTVLLVAARGPGTPVSRSGFHRPSLLTPISFARRGSGVWLCYSMSGGRHQRAASLSCRHTHARGKSFRPDTGSKPSMIDLINWS